MTVHPLQRKKLRTGFTTGTCAAGAAKAAALMLLGKAPGDKIDVTLPDGKNAQLPLEQCEATGNYATAAIQKDGGDDPDITTGLSIYAKVTLNDGDEIHIDGGEGVGRVTLKGLKVPIGDAAINPVPREMIKVNLTTVLPKGKGADVLIYIPGGEEVARRTFNPKLGIIGGLSILGSTGIVHPMSEDALKESLRLELNILRERGFDTAIFAFGNYGISFLKSKKIDEKRVIKISNYIGFMLDCGMELGFQKILLVGHLGKLVKVAGGIFQTHSRKADCRMEIITAYAGLAGASKTVLEELYQCKTTSAAAEIIAREHLEEIYQRIAENATARCKSYTYNEITFGSMVFGDENKLLYCDKDAESILKELATDEQ